MDHLINLIIEHAHNAHYIAFAALMLAGLSLPISEDLLIIICAVIASTVIPENTIKIFIWIFFGCYLSDVLVFWIGRSLSNKLLKYKWFKKIVPQKKLDWAQIYYQKHGFKTLLLGRFIPFGIRNCLFLTAGMSKMSFTKFLISDGIACILTSTLLFFTTFHLGKNYDVVIHWIKTFHLLVIVLLFALVIAGLFWFYKKRQKIQLK
jgi:membrane protein DedA with SNARE-associated domain